MQNLAGNMDPQALVFSAHSPSQPHIVYFISRSNGMLVPLVPADELPYNVRLHGLPRTLRFDQTYGMQHVGTQPYTGATFKLENETSVMRPASQPPTPAHSRNSSSSPSKQFLPPDALARQAITNVAGAGNEQHPLPQRPMSAHDLTTMPWRKTPTSSPVDKTQAVIDAIVGAKQGPEAVRTQSAAPPSGSVPDQDKKEFCTYWIRTGECDYTQQGCLYKHEMPDPDTLKAIGFRGTPKWWIEKNQKVKLGSTKPLRLAEMPSWWPGQIGGAAKATNSDGSDGTTSEAGSVDSEPKVLSTSSKAAGPAKSISASAHAPNTDNIDSLSDSDDLIDLDTPLTPATTPPTSPEKDATPEPTRIVHSVPGITAIKPNQADSATPPPKKQVFVPAGESPEAHIAQAKKRAGGQTRSSASRTSKTAEAQGLEKQMQSLEKQMQSLQKGKYSGLMASKYAPTGPTTARSAETMPMGRKRVPRRDRAVAIRRPDTVASRAPEYRAERVLEPRGVMSRRPEAGVVVNLPGTDTRKK